MLFPKKKKKKTVVFLCTGDTCRSPMAQGYLKKLLEERGWEKKFDVKTAGVMTIPGLIPTQEASQVMEGTEIDITGHRSVQLSPEMIKKSDLILGMTPFHVQSALRMSEDARDKTFLLKEFAGSDVKNYQVNDPMGMTLEVYKRVYREICLACDKLVEKEFFTGMPEAEYKKMLRAKKRAENGKKKSTGTKKKTSSKKKASSTAS